MPSSVQVTAKAPGAMHRRERRHPRSAHVAHVLLPPLQADPNLIGPYWDLLPDTSSRPGTARNIQDLTLQIHLPMRSYIAFSNTD